MSSSDRALRLAAEWITRETQGCPNFYPDTIVPWDCDEQYAAGQCVAVDCWVSYFQAKAKEGIE